jgi:hypothetical protein
MLDATNGNIVTDVDKYKDRFGDIWFRARHNALANMEAAIFAKNKAKKWEIITSIFIVVPIFGFSLANVFEECSDIIGLFSSLFSAGALFLTLVGFIQENKTNLNYHSKAHSIFNNIAQKARRGSNSSLSDNELQYLIRSLEEMFETAKNNTSEPTDENYNKGLERMKNMPRWPFGLVKDNDG